MQYTLCSTACLDEGHEQDIVTCRPAVAVSYVVSAVAALLSGLAYAEFVVDLPISGGATCCILLTFGELPSW